MTPHHFITAELPCLRRRHPGLRMRLKPGLVDPAAVRLALITIDDPRRRGQGLGSAFMGDLIAACDRHGLALELEIVETDADHRRRLERFYQRFGLAGAYSEVMDMTFLCRSPAPAEPAPVMS